MKAITLGDTIDSLEESDITSLQSALQSNSTCGDDMKRLTDRAWLIIANLRRENPSISEDEIRVKMVESNLMLHEIPTVTNNCMVECDGDNSIASFGPSTDTAVEGLPHCCKPQRVGRRAVVDLPDEFCGAANGLEEFRDHASDVRGSQTATNIMALSDMEYTYSSAERYVPLSQVPELMRSSRIPPKVLRKVSRVVRRLIRPTPRSTAPSRDTEDVHVNAMSGGNKIAEVAVHAGTNVTWVSNVTALGARRCIWIDGGMDSWESPVPEVGPSCFGSPINSRRSAGAHHSAQC